MSDLTYQMQSDPNGIFFQPALVDKLKRYQSSRLRGMQMAPTGVPLTLSPQGNVWAQPSFKHGGDVRNDVKQIAKHGRHGDDTLLHVNSKELGGLANIMRRQPTTNPSTGLPEAFSWSDLLPIAAGAAATFFAPELGLGTLGTSLLAGGASGAARMLTGGNLQQGLMTGLMAGGAAGLGSLIEGGGNAAQIAAPAQQVADTGSIPMPEAPPAPPPAPAPAPEIAQPQWEGYTPPTDTAYPENEPGMTTSSATPSAPTMANQAPAPVYEATPPAPAHQSTWDILTGKQARPYEYALGAGLAGNYLTNTAPPVGNPNPLPPSNWSPVAPWQRKMVMPPPGYDPNVSGEWNYFPSAAAGAFVNDGVFESPPSLTGGKVGGLPNYDHPSHPMAETMDSNGANKDEMKFATNLAEGGIAQMPDDGDAAMVTALRQHYPTRAEAERAAHVKGSFAQQVGALPGSAILDYAYGPQHEVVGDGDGMSDDVPATINGREPAQLADGEFVVPADVVSHLGNGSTKAGAAHLYKMMERVRKARTGNPKQGKEIDAEQHLPA